MNWLAFWVLGAVLIGFAGLNRRMGYAGAFAIALGLGLIPVAGQIAALVIIIGSKRMQPRGCPHCGNAENEAEYCNLCGKNAAGDQRPDGLR